MTGASASVPDSGPARRPPTGGGTGRPAVGALLADGRTSEVFAFGADQVVKVPRPGVPPHWSRIEAEIAEAVHGCGLPTPEVLGLVEIEGRESIVYRRITGPSMWRMLLARPAWVDEAAQLLVGVQTAIHRTEAPTPVPELQDRAAAKILTAEGLSAAERQRAHTLSLDLPAGGSLCHGDLHPGNVLMGDDGPVVIDWFDATAGHPEADVVRTSLLLRPPSHGAALTPHLPGAWPALLDHLHRAFLEAALCEPGNGAIDRQRLLDWELVLAAGRLSEHTTADRADLLALCTGEPADAEPSALARFLADRRPHEQPSDR